MSKFSDQDSSSKTKVRTYHGGSEPSLEDLQGFVGGYIQVLESKNGKCDIIIDEEGKLKDKPFNRLATKLWLGDEKDWYDIIVGDAVICEGDSRLK